MPDRPLVQEIVEIGVETTPGTAVASAVKLSGLQVDLGTSIEFDRFAPMGNLWDTISAPRQEYGVGSIAGFPTYPELAYVFSNVFGAATVTTPGTGAARRYSWAPSSSVPWTPRTWTIRRGMVGNTAESAAYGLMAGVGMSFSRTAPPEISGDLFTRALDYAATVGATGLSALSVIPVLPGEVCVYMDPTSAALGTTRLTREIFLASFDIGGLFGPFWPLDCTQPSFGGHVPLKSDAGATLQLGNDTQGRALITDMRAGSTQYCRIEATGPVIEGAIHHRLRIDMALKVVEAPTRGDSDGLSTLEWGFGIFDDVSFGGAIKVELTTNVPSI